MEELRLYQKHLAETYLISQEALEVFHNITITYKNTRIRNNEEEVLFSIVKLYQKATTLHDYITIKKRCEEILEQLIFTRPAHAVTCVKLLRLAQWQIKARLLPS